MSLKIEDTDLNCLFHKVSNTKSNNYVVLPNLKVPRLIVPIFSFRSFKLGLSFQNTSSRKNRVIKLFIPFFYLYFKRYYKYRVSFSSEFNDELKEIYNILEINSDTIISIYIGTPNIYNRKLTILLMHKNGEFIGIIKYPLVKESDKYICNEYITLKNLLNSPKFDSIFFPSNLKLIEVNCKKVLFYENIFINTRKLKNELNDLIFRASIELAEKTRRNSSKNYFIYLLENLSCIVELETEVKKKLEKIIFNVSVSDIPLVLLHGDFVLYNMQSDGKFLYLIDWEFSRMGLPLFDLFHFVYQGKYQIEKKSIEECINEMFNSHNTNFFKKYLRLLLIEDALYKQLFCLYLIDAYLYLIKLNKDTNTLKREFISSINYFISNYHKW